MRPEFGCRIHEYVFGTMDYDTLRQMEGAVTEALILWEPRIEEIRSGRILIRTGTGPCF